MPYQEIPVKIDNFQKVWNESQECETVSQQFR